MNIKNRRKTQKKIIKNIKKTSSQVSLIGKRESFENEKKPMKFLTKKQRRNKHCKQNFEWLLEGSEENSKKKQTSQINSFKNPKPTPATKFVLKRDTKGLGVSVFNNSNRKKIISKLESESEKKKEILKSGQNKGTGSTKNGRISLRKTTTGRISLQLEGKSSPMALKANRKSLNLGNSKISKALPKMVWNSRGQCDESTKLRSKINKVRTYWNRTSLLIPNVFRHVCELKENSNMLFEYLDLSRKELLVQANGQKAISQAGAPHLQRKNKVVHKESVKKKIDSIISEKSISIKKVTQKKNFKIQAAKFNVKTDSLFNMNEINEFKQEKKQSEKLKIIKPKIIEINEKKKIIKTEKKNEKEFSIKENKDYNQNKKNKKNSEEIIKKESQEIIEDKIEKMKKQLREDLTKAHQKIEESFISEKAENWSRTDLDAFNNNISEYNQLLDEQEKLKIFQFQEMEGENSKHPSKLKLLNQSALQLLEKKLSNPNSDKIKEKISIYMKRKGFKNFNSMNQDCQIQLSEANSGYPLTLQDILKLELQSSSTGKQNSNPVSKLSKRIQKKRSDSGKKNLQAFLAPSNSGRKRNSNKKHLLSSTNQRGLSSKRKKSEDIEIVLEMKEEDLVVSINPQSRLEESDTSICSLDNYVRKVQRLQNGKMIIQN